MKYIPQKPFFYLTAYLLWFLILWKLSSGKLPEIDGPKIPYFDKVLHTGYFLGGAGLLSAFLYLKNQNNLHWHRIIILVFICGAIVGRLDEWHQSRVVGRSGNDINDYVADIVGTLLGFLIFKKLHTKVFFTRGHLRKLPKNF